jgi:hypothetical protein
MNYSTAVFLINNHARAINVTYESDDNAKRETVKTLDPTIKVDDFVVVQSGTRHKMTVCKVVETDVDFDLESSTPMNWIVGKVDDEAFKLTLQQEQQAIQAIKSAELRQKRDNLRDNLLKDHLGTIKALPLASMNGDLKPDDQAA